MKEIAFKKSIFKKSIFIKINRSQVIIGKLYIMEISATMHIAYRCKEHRHCP